MSYILDALQRADAERTRGSVPTLQAQPLTSASTQSGLGPKQRMGLLVAAAGLLGAAATVWWTGGGAPAPAPALSASTPAPVAAPLVPLAVQQAPTVTSVAKVTTAVAPPMPPASSPKAAVSVAVAAPPRAEAVAPGPSVAPLLSELPEATRRQIPTLAISGAVYSDNPAQRLLLVNGLVLNQGSEVAADLTLVEIRSNSSEFSFKGTRFRLAH
ncbi:MAG: general secretion pathway protein GspB [Pseudomonadota bacterium]